MDGRPFSGTGSAPGSVPAIGVIDYCVFSGSPPASGECDIRLALLDVISGLDYGLRACFLVLQTFGCVSESEGRGTVVWGGQLSSFWFSFNLAWLLWYQRPETLPTAAILAVSLLLVAGKSPGA